MERNSTNVTSLRFHPAVTFEKLLIEGIPIHGQNTESSAIRVKEVNEDIHGIRDNGTRHEQDSTVHALQPGIPE